MKYFLINANYKYIYIERESKGNWLNSYNKEKHPK